MISKESFVQEQLVSRGIKKDLILNAFKNVPREIFVPEHLRSRAYEDNPLPIGYGQTISQPYTVAFMTELLDPQPEDVVLEVGTGSGYQAAILSKLVKKVYSLEIIEELANMARENLKSAGIANVEVAWGSGFEGLERFAPYDEIVVTAGAEEIPLKLVDQLKIGGRLVIPSGKGYVKQMLRITKTEKGMEQKSLGEFSFVPLVR